MTSESSAFESSNSAGTRVGAATCHLPLAERRPEGVESDARPTTTSQVGEVHHLEVGEASSELFVAEEVVVGGLVQHLHRCTCLGVGDSDQPEHGGSPLGAALGDHSGRKAGIPRLTRPPRARQSQRPSDQDPGLPGGNRVEQQVGDLGPHLAQARAGLWRSLLGHPAIDEAVGVDVVQLAGLSAHGGAMSPDC